MRKILAAVLALVMVVAVFAALPVTVSAAKTSDFDSFTSDITFDLLVTEFAYDTTCTNTTIPEVKEARKNDNCYQYVELYNNSDSAIDLYNLCLLRQQDTASSTGSIWRNNKTFGNAANVTEAKKMNFVAGDIYDGVPDMTAAKKTELNTSKKAGVENPGSAILQPGQFAIVWVWSNDCISISTKEGGSLAASAGGRSDFPRFRDHYATVSGIQKYKNNNPGDGFTDEFQALEDTLIIAVCGASAASSTYCCDLYNYSSIFAIAKQDVEVNLLAEENGNRIYCYFGQDMVGRKSLGMNVPDQVSLYMPAASTPDLPNALLKIDFESDEGNAGKTFVPKEDYVDLGTSLSYKELGLYTASETPSIGAMPAYQWAYIAPDKVPTLVADGKTALISDWATNTAIKDGEGLAADWATKAIAAVVADRAKAPEQVDEHAETTREADQDLRDQDEWERQKGSNAKKKTAKKSGLPTWALILIIAGGVLVVGGATVTVIFVVKAKKNNTADAEFDAEGEVAEEAAAQDVAAEEAAEAEDKKDE